MVRPVSVAGDPELPFERASLPRAVDTALVAYRKALHAAFGERLKEFRLFGSYAREEARPESDVDVFVTVEGLTHAERDVAFDLAYEVELQGEWVGLSPRRSSAKRVVSSSLPSSSTRGADSRSDAGLHAPLPRREGGVSRPPLTAV